MSTPSAKAPAAEPPREKKTAWTTDPELVNIKYKQELDALGASDKRPASYSAGDKMSNTPLKDLPKLASSIQGELKDVALKKPEHHVETVEKIVLPTAEDLKQEKTHEKLLEDVEQFNIKRQLSHSEDTVVKNVLPSKEDVAQEKQHQQLLNNVEQFNRANLTHTPTEEKVVLPGAQDIVQEKQEENIRKSVEGFNKSELKHVKCEEKVVLPTADVIAAEKKAAN